MPNYQIVILFILLKIVIVFNVNPTLNHDTNEDYSVCKKQNCIKKCCPENYILVKKKCVQTDQFNFTLTVFDGTEEVNESVYFNVIHNRDCKDGTRLRLSPSKYKEDIYYVQKNGSLFTPYSSERVSTGFDKFCMEFLQVRNRTEFAVLVCKTNVIPEPEGVCSYGKFSL